MRARRRTGWLDHRLRTDTHVPVTCSCEGARGSILAVLEAIAVPCSKSWFAPVPLPAEGAVDVDAAAALPSDITDEATDRRGCAAVDAASRLAAVRPGERVPV